ncbi:flagellar hook protein FlgE [Limnoglobus roseus]|uniref:Flagellar hook protein FlgE n=1 Tax=Limnoglobus roseus TaxID=2598579 RepID=A0A5C1A810_9BACT|nr:flagellar hook protein FlgE [Limnoglobus roseus]QEL13308.1 flagellar hook protein FlgE [Limnoglobus roseus]
MTLAALFSGASGLAANSTALDVVGNNLANLNTTGYKTQRTLFRDQVYQLLDGGSAAGVTGSGGTNASQLGNGVTVGTIDTQFTQGAVNPTGRSLDAAISGNGFFVLRSPTGQLYSRAGNFDVDSSGFLVEPSTGNRIQRTGTAGEGSATLPGFQVAGNNDIRVPIGSGVPGVPTSNVTFRGNVSSKTAVGDPAVNLTPIQFFDSQSGSHTLSVSFTKTADNTYSVSATATDATVTLPPTSVTFDTSGKLLSPASLAISITGIAGAATQTVNLNFGTPGQSTGLTQTGDATDGAAVTQDGSGSGTLLSVSIDANGTIQGLSSNGRTVPVAQLAIASFNNQGGLIRAGTNTFSTGPGSGEPLIGSANTGGRGAISGGALEGAGVDIAVEFSRLIIAQRGFQVNARTISAANDTLQELANIIR